MSEELKPTLKMHAYYYGFLETGVYEIDKILSAIACAGKSYHHTEDWNDEEWPNNDCWSHYGHSGKSCIEMIENAASEAAKAWNTRPSEPRCKDCVDRNDCSIFYWLDHHTNAHDDGFCSEFKRKVDE